MCSNASRFEGSFVDGFPRLGVWTEAGGKAQFDVTLDGRTALRDVITGEKNFVTKKHRVIPANGREGGKDERGSIEIPHLHDVGL